MTQHKWHREIKAWADGAQIECKYIGDKYTHSYWGPWDDGPIDWNDEDYEFRVVEKPKDPQYLYVYGSINGLTDVSICQPKMAKLAGWNYIGKIKLEIED